MNVGSGGKAKLCHGLDNLPVTRRELETGLGFGTAKDWLSQTHHASLLVILATVGQGECAAITQGVLNLLAASAVAQAGTHGCFS